MALAQRLLERTVELLGRDFLALLEVQRHEIVIDLDHLIDQRRVRLAHRREIRLALRTEEAIDHGPARLGGQVDRQALASERFLHGAQHGGRIDVFRVDLVDDHHPAQAARCRPLHHPPRRQLDAVLRVDDDRRHVDRRQRADRLSGEIGVSRRVDQMDVDTLVREVNQGGVQRMPGRLLQRVEVAHRGAALDAAHRLDRAGPEQQRFGERGLACAGVADQSQGTDGLASMNGHGGFSSLSDPVGIRGDAVTGRAAETTADPAVSSGSVRCDSAVSVGGRARHARGRGRVLPRSPRARR